MTNHEYEDLMRRVAEALGWSADEARSLSLSTLRALLGSSHPKLVAELSRVILSGSHVARPV